MEPKYDSTRGGWCSNEVVGPFKVRVWKNFFFFFFEKSIEYIKSAKGCNPWYTEGVEKHYKLVGVFSLDLSDLMWEMCPRSILA
jgi:hypothetical protein